MNDPVDSAIENAESQTREGQKRGPRDRYYFCGAIRGKGIVQEPIMASSQEEAKELFKDKHNLNALFCNDGRDIKGGGSGFYLAMGTGMSDAQRISVTVTPAQLARRTTKAIKAEFKGWHVYGSGLAACTVKVGHEDVEFEDDDLISIEFGERVEPDSKVQKPKLKKKEVVRIDDLNNVQAL